MNSATTFRIGVIPLAAILLSGLAACAGGSQPDGDDQITLAVYEGTESTLLYVAQAEGFFADEGLQVTLNGYEAGKLAADAMLAGDADVAAATDFAFVTNSLERDDLSVLGSISSRRPLELVARQDHGIASPADLTGKRIGVTLGSSGEYALGTFLASNGLSSTEVEVVDLTPTALVDAMVAGTIDAAMTWDPNAYNVKQALETAVSWGTTDDYPLFFVLLTQQQFVTERADTAERLVRALVRAEEHVSIHNEDTRAFVRDTFGYEQDYVDAIWPNYEFAVTLPQALLIVLGDQARWRIRNGLTTATDIPNYLEVLYLAGLDAVSPGSVTIIR